MPSKTKNERHIQILVPVKKLHSKLTVDHAGKNLDPDHKPSTGRFVAFGRTIHKSTSRQQTPNTGLKSNNPGHRLKCTYVRPSRNIITIDQRMCDREKNISEAAGDVSKTYKIIQITKDILDIQTESDLMTAKSYINQRMTDCIARWEEHNNFKLEWLEDLEFMLQQEKNNVFYPSGFGFHLANERAYSKEGEPEFSKLYDAIMLLDDKETQDLLLCFLDDFKMKREALKQISLHRSNLLSEVQHWMAKIRLKHDVKEINYKYALECGISLGERYCAAMHALEKLKRLKIDIRKRRTPPEPREARTPSQVKEVAECFKMVPMASELLDIVKENKDEMNESQCEDMVGLLEDLAKFVVTRQTEIANTAAMIEQRKADMQALTRKQHENEKVFMKLKLHLQELERKQFLIQSRFEIKKTLANALVQTECTALPPRRIKPPPKQKLVRAAIMSPNKLTRFEETVDKAIEAAVTKGQMASSIESKRHRFYATPLNSLEGGLPKQPYSSGPIENVKFVQVDKAHDTAEKKQKVKKAKQVGKEQVQRTQNIRVPLSRLLFGTEDSPVVTEVKSSDLLDMTQKLCKNILTRLKFLQSTLIRYRHDAREELQGIKAKEEKVVELSKTIRDVLDVIEAHPKQLPMFETTDDKVDVQYRHNPLHKCRFCCCHQDVPSVTLESKATAEAVGKTLDHCQIYVGLITKVKLRYSMIINQLVEAQSSLWRGLDDLLWSAAGVRSKGTEFSNLDQLVDENIILYIKTLELAVENEEDLADVMERARDLTTAVKNMTVHVINIIHDTEEQLTEVKEQNDFLCSVEEQLDRAEELLQSTMVEVCQLRCRQDVLVTGRIVTKCRCHYCRCYNSPLGDGIGSVMKEATYQMALSAALSAIVKGLASVEVKAYNEDGSPYVLCALKPEVLSLVSESRLALLRCLGVAFHVKHELITPSKQELHHNNVGN